MTQHFTANTVSASFWCSEREEPSAERKCGVNNRPKHDPLQYVRDYYQVPAYVGMRVSVYGKTGVIVGGNGPYIRIHLDGQKHDGNYHPTDGVTYLVEGTTCGI